ncbi:hypothetical protein WICMUC_002668 [Wickerhamomyces mucosus]|uniref:Potassium transport protein n=1 Tax=Wickerhamomyces mucosus TaxID=1378264 RepID=A0A9P8PQA3_9ASCO|nr:hypothetical protein WICMUC_002668 [Wickerhamomyces mucosus]
MRRTATMMERQRTMESQRSRFLRSNQSNNNSNTNKNNNLNHENQQNESPSSRKESTTSSELLNDTQPISYKGTFENNGNNHNSNGYDSEMVDHISEPSDNEDQIDKSHQNDSHGGIKFAELPKPTRQEVTPRDVYMSISMLRNQPKNETNDQEEDEGPALIIRGPAERDIQFQEPEKPRQKSHNNSYNNKNKRKSPFRRSFNYLTRPVSLIHDPISSRDNEEGLNLEITQSNLQLPSKDETNGLKYCKRSNTLDTPGNSNEKLPRQPTIDKIRRNLTKRKNSRRVSSIAIDDSASSINSDHHRRHHQDYDHDYDEENNVFDGNDNNNNNDHEDDYSLRRRMSTNYLSWNPQVGRNSTFGTLTYQQKEELGGVEYRALKLLVKILLVYYIGFHLLGILFLTPWIYKSSKYAPLVKDDEKSLAWWGIFTSMSSFNDLGFTLTPNSMNSFNTSAYVLLILSFFIVIGNTGFPVFLRFIIWCMFKVSKDLSLIKESLGFLLDHPRRCFTLLFPSAPTWWLLFILIVMNGIDLILFIVLDIGATIFEGFTTGTKILDGFFQAISTRTAGFSCVDLSQLHPAVQVSYMVMMYISVLPIAISIRRTNVYEEQSLGVYAVSAEGLITRSSTNNESISPNESTEDSKPTSFIGAHLRKQLSFDLWFVFLGVFIICIAEGEKIQDSTLPEFNVFQILFEVVSAYGTVGMSLGYPNTFTSFSGQFNVISKLVIISMMIRGRHRGLPYSLDRAIMLPSKKMEERDLYQSIHHKQHETIDLSNVNTMEDDPVIQFFKSAAPKILREHIRTPSFLRRPSTIGRTSSTRRSTLGNKDLRNIDNHNNGNNNIDQSNPNFRNIHFGHTQHTQQTEDNQENIDPMRYEMDDFNRNNDDDDNESPNESPNEFNNQDIERNTSNGTV